MTSVDHVTKSDDVIRPRKTGSEIEEDPDEFSAMLDDLNSMNEDWMDTSENMVGNGCVSNGKGHAHNAYISDAESRLDDDEKRRSDRNDVDAQRLDDMLFTVEEVPPWYLCILLGLQNCMTCFGANLSVALIIAPAMCIYSNVIISQVLGTIFFMAGLVSLLQSTVGTRLPLVQGATFAYIVPTFAILNLPQWKCPPISNPVNDDNSTTWLLNNTLATQPTVSDSNSTTSLSDEEKLWKPRMLEIQGAIILASLFEIVVGFSGLVGILVRYIGPLVIAPTITLVGLTLFSAAANFAAKNWYIAILTSLLIIIFSQYLRNLKIPLCTLNERRKCVRTGYPIFTLFPVILGILLAWALCAILTFTDAIPDVKSHWSYQARTDVKISVLREAAWFRFPYPFQWGRPTFSVGAVFGMLGGVIAGAIESIGDYYSCARLSGAPPPPIHAVNRGIFMEGIGCVLAGMWGSGSGSTTYGENIGAIGITKVGSRRVVQWASVFLMLFGVLGKFGALFVTIPDPVIGGVFLVMFGIIASVGVSNLQYVDLNSSRNLCIYGFSVFFGLAFPKWLADDNHVSYIKTGSIVVDQIFGILLSTSMFVGGSIGFILDNTIPGTEKERGLLEWRANLKGSSSSLEVAATQAVVSPVAMASGEPSLAETSSNVFPATSVPDNTDVHYNDASSNADFQGSVNNGMSDESLAETDRNLNSVHSGIPDSAALSNGVPPAVTMTTVLPKRDKTRRRSLECYELPLIGKLIRKYPICRFIPILPTFLEPVNSAPTNSALPNSSTSINGNAISGRIDSDIESARERDRDADDTTILGDRLERSNGRTNSATEIEGVSYEMKQSSDL